MSKVRYNSDSMKLIMLFESMTGARVKDCIFNEKLIFIIEENEMGKAVGKNGANIKKVENILKKKIKLIEFNPNILHFVRNMIYPIELADVKEEDGVITIHGKNTITKAMIIGRERQNLNRLIEIVKRYFKVKEVKVL